MTTPELIPKGTHDDVRDDASRRGHEQEEWSRRPATRRKVRRWELGFFIRKIVNGWLAYYKKFPPRSGSEAPGATSRSAPTDPAEDNAQEVSISGPVQPLSGHAQGNDDTGPIGETSLEAGMFLRSTTEETDDEGEVS